MLTTSTNTFVVGVPDENNQILYASHTTSAPQFVVLDLPECQVCGKKTSEVNFGRCMHVMHKACQENGGCRACYAKVESKALGYAINIMGGANGSGFLLMHDFQQAILNALCPGVYFANSFLFAPVIKKVLARVQSTVTDDDVDGAVFLLSCHMMYPPEFAVFSMWVVGMYYWETPFEWLGEPPYVYMDVLSIAAMLTAYVALQYNDTLGVFAISAMCWVQLWRWPNYWDVHCGNCFLLLPLAGYVMMCFGAAVFINETFSKYGFVQVFILSKLFFKQRTVKHIVSPRAAYIIVITGLQVVILILMTHVFHLRGVIKTVTESQKNDLKAAS